MDGVNGGNEATVSINNKDDINLPNHATHRYMMRLKTIFLLHHNVIPCVLMQEWVFPNSNYNLAQTYTTPQDLQLKTINEHPSMTMILP